MAISKRVRALEPLLLEELKRFPVLKGIPTEYFLAYIAAESGGDWAGDETKIGRDKKTGELKHEKGLFRVYGVGRRSDHLTDAEFAAITTSKVLSMRYGLKAVASTVGRVAKVLGSDASNTPDFLYYLKLHHGLPKYVNLIGKYAVKYFGGPPPSFDHAEAYILELAKDAPHLFSDPGHTWGAEKTITRIFANAKKVGTVLGDSIKSLERRDNSVRVALSRLLALKDAKPLDVTALRREHDALGRLLSLEST